MYAVTGVTGNTGSVVAEELLRRGEKVRVIVRNAEKGSAWRDKGAEVVVASVDDGEALGRALEGTEGAYLLLPPDMSTTDAIARAQKIGDAFAAAIRKSGVPHVVFLSSIGGQHDAGTGPIRALHEIELRLRATGINLTILRPTYFLENWASVLPAAVQNGVLPSFLPADLTFPMIATKDIGVAAADALLHPPTGERILELAGPRDYSPNDIATAVGSVLGRKVEPAVAPLDAVVPTFVSFGVSEHVASLFREMYEGVISGHVAWDGKGERKRGSATPEETFRPMLQSA
jgi:uncharacterized protein YbjT (DUF2867 family)